MAAYTHDAWLASLTPRTILIQGDANALAAIRRATREHYGVDDITDDAPVYAWHGLYVKGLGSMAYQVPDAAARDYIRRPAWPAHPIAVMPLSAQAEDAVAPIETEAESLPAIENLDDDDDVLLLTDRIVDDEVEVQAMTASTDAPINPESRRAEFIEASEPVEGSDVALQELRERTRLYHEVPAALFPTDGEARWFRDGIYIMGAGDDPAMFQAPMDRLDDMILPREYPLLPQLIAPKSTS